MILNIIALLIISSGLVYFIWRSLTLANVTADQEEYIQELEEMSQYMYDQINIAYQEMRKIDSREAFEKDDETGTVFSQLKQVVTNLQKEFNAETEEKK
jgi:phage-related minor tail protein